MDSSPIPIDIDIDRLWKLKNQDHVRLPNAACVNRRQSRWSAVKYDDERPQIYGFAFRILYDFIGSRCDL